MKVVSFSLWGCDPKYWVGALRNAQLVREIYPGWTARFYVHENVAPHIRRELIAAGAQVEEMTGPGDWTGLVWRYLAIEDPAVSVAVFRDCDSRLTVREQSAVNEWLLSGRALHVMRDHPRHVFPIMGGMWGVRCSGARWIPALLRSQGLGAYYQADQLLLAREVWPRLKHDCIEHDEFGSGRAFPMLRTDDQFVGQIYSSEGEPCMSGIRSLRAALKRLGKSADASR
jgi:hypothetical protein